MTMLAKCLVYPGEEKVGRLTKGEKGRVIASFVTVRTAAYTNISSNASAELAQRRLHVPVKDYT
ncbi:hypothetical protein N7507_006654 [Penicillium longicatenatum]|nr:hypothetical protein N7507_006654 [Penicillium longicatenatum]